MPRYTSDMASVWKSRLVLGLLAAVAITTHDPLSARAADSTWFVCTGVVTPSPKARHIDKRYIAVSLLEHRAPDGEHRNLDVTLMRGALVWRSVIWEKKVGEFWKKHVPFRIMHGKRTIFRGTAKIDFRSKKFELRGKLDMNFGHGKPLLLPATATLNCVKLDDLAIGHGAP